MSWFDKIKETASDIAGSVAEEFSGSEEEKKEAPRQEVENTVSGLKQPDAPPDDGPSGVVHKGMEKAASVILGASKKTVDLVVKRVRPNLQLDAFLEPKDIKVLLEAAEDAGLGAVDQVVLGCNNVATVALARQMHGEVAEQLQQEIDQLRVVTEGENEENEMLELLRKEHAAWTAPDQPVNLMLAAVEAARDGETETCVRLAQQMTDGDAALNNPVMARVAAEHGEQFGLGQDELRAWITRALYYRPLDPALLGAMVRLAPEPEKGIYEAMLKLAR